MAGVEAFGAVASAVQLASTCIQITESLIAFYSRLADAPKSIARQKEHIAQLMEIARLIQRSPALQTTLITFILASINKEAQNLRDIVAKATSAQGALSRSLKLVGYTFRERQIQSIWTRLEGDKTILLLGLSCIDSSLLHSIGHELTKLQDRTENVLKELPAIHNSSQASTVTFGQTLANQLDDIQNRIPSIAGGITEIKNRLPTIISKMEHNASSVTELMRLIKGSGVSTKHSVYGSSTRCSLHFIFDKARLSQSGELSALSSISQPVDFDSSRSRPDCVTVSCRPLCNSYPSNTHCRLY